MDLNLQRVMPHIPSSRSADAFYSLKRLDNGADKHRSPARYMPELYTPERPLLLASQAMKASFNVRVETQWGDKVRAASSLFAHLPAR